MRRSSIITDAELRKIVKKHIYESRKPAGRTGRRRIDESSGDKTPVLRTYREVSDAVYDYAERNWPGDLESGKTHYKAALKALGFTRDGYDQYGADAYSNGKVRVAVFYDRGEGCWDMEEASGRSDTTDDFYNTSSEMQDEYGNYGSGSFEDPWNKWNW